MQHGLNGKLQLGDNFNARARIKNNRYKRDYAAKNIAFAPAILSVAGKIHSEFLRLLWEFADMQTVKYFNLVGDEETSGMSVASSVGLAHSAIIGMRLALPLHTLQPYYYDTHSLVGTRHRSPNECRFCSPSISG